MPADDFFNAYVECALWSSLDVDGEPLDRLSQTDIAPETLATMRADCDRFYSENQRLLGIGGWSDSQAGHDFWLTRNGHGAGFWDRGKGRIGDILTDRCKAYGECDLYIGDDGKIYLT